MNATRLLKAGKARFERQLAAGSHNCCDPRTQLPLHGCSQAALDVSPDTAVSPRGSHYFRVLRQHLSQRGSRAATQTLRTRLLFSSSQPHTLLLKQLFRSITYQQFVSQPTSPDTRRRYSANVAQNLQNLQTERRPQSRAAPLFTLPPVRCCPCVHIPEGEFLEMVRGMPHCACCCWCGKATL